MKQNRVVDFAQKIRERVSAAAAKRLARAALAVCLVAGCAALSATAVSAEGTRDIVRTSRENYAAVKNVKLPENTSEQTYSFQTYDGWDEYIARWCFRAQDDSFVGVNRQQKVKFYANEGETIYIGSSSDNDTKDIMITLPDQSTVDVDLTETAGVITTKDEELAGPNGVVLDGKEVTGGYNPYVYVAPQNGVYVVTFYSAKESGIATNTDGTAGDITKSTLKKEDFTKGPTLSGSTKNYIVYAWDITVTRKNSENKPEAINGRVWMDALATEIYSAANCGMYGYLYAVSRDGYIWRFGLNGMKPYTFAMYANTRGNISSATNASAYHSVHSPIDNYTAFDFYKNLKDKYGNLDGVYLLGPDNDETDIDMPCHMFINEPDENIPDTIVKTTPAAPGKLTSMRYDGSDVEDEAAGSGGDEKKNNLGFVGVDGYFEIETENASSYRIIIDMSNMYAISYHGEEDGSSHHDESIHDDEICLGAGSEKDGETDDTGIDPNNFIYHDSANQWYAIRTIKQTGGKWDHHPTNEIPASGTASEDDFSGIIKIVSIESPQEYNKDGEDFTTKDGKVYKCLGKVLLGNAAVSGKTDRIRWNGRDQYGRVLPVGTYFGTTGRGEIYAQIKAGEVHFPLCDVENMPNGVSVKLMNPIDDNVSVDKISKIYYNNEDKSLLHEYPATVPNSKNGRISWIWNLPQGSNSKAGQTTTNAGKSDWRTTGAVFENYSIDGIASIVEVDGVEKMTNNASKFQDGNTNNGDTGSDHGVVDVWTHVVDETKYPLNDTIYLYHISDQMIVQGFVFFDGNTPGGDSKYDLSGNDTALYNATVVAEWGAVTSESLQKYNGTKDPTVLEFQKNGKNTYGYYETSTNTDGIYSIPIDTTLFQVQGKATDYVANTEHYVRITVTYEDEHTGKASITTHKVTTASEKAAQKIEEKPNVSVQIVSVKSDEFTNLKEINAEQVGYAIMPTTNPLRIRKIWTPDQLRDPSMTSTFTIKGILKNSATNPDKPEEDTAFDNPDNIVFTLENVSVDENLGGIVDITSLPQYGYTIEKGKHLSSDVVPKNGVAATDLQKIIYRVEENLKKESDSAIAPDILHDSNYNLEGTTGGAGTTVTTFDYWQFTNTIETSSLTVKVWYDKDNDGTFDTGEDSYLENAEITMGVKNPSSGELEGFKTFPGYKPGEEYKLDPVIIEPDKVNNTDKDGTFEFSGIGAGVYNVTVKFPTADNYNTYWENGVTYKADGDVKRMIFNKGVQQNIVISEFTVGSGDNGVLEIRVGGFEDVMSLGDKFTIKKQFTSNAVDKIPQGKAEFGLKIQTRGDEGAWNDVSEGTATAVVNDEDNLTVDFDLSGFKAKITSTDSTLYLSEKTDSGEAGYIAGVDYDESEYEITVKATNNPGTDKLKPTTTYTISEVKKVKDENGVEITDEKIEPTDGKYNITFNNDYSVGRLTIKIGETEGESADRNAKFGISLTPVGTALVGNTYKYEIFNEGSSEAVSKGTTSEFAVGSVLKVCDLTEKQYVVIYDLPLGVSLTVGEDLADGYSLKEKKIDNEISSQNNVDIKATAAADGLNNRTVEFINLHKEGSLSITKTVSVKDPTKDPDFTFNITIDKPSAAAISALSIANSIKKSYNVASPLMTKSTISAPAPIALGGFDYNLTLKITDSEEEVTGSPKSVEFKDGEATVKLKGGQTATISGLPDGYSYNVVEADMPAGFVEGDKSNDSGKIVYNDTAAATFTNNFKTGSLSIENTTTDGSAGEYTFEIALTAPSGVDFAESYAYTVNDVEQSEPLKVVGNVITLTLKGGETAVIKDLPAGTHFEITETPASGYVLTYVEVGGAEDADKTANGTIPDGSGIAAQFRNSPTVTVTISGTKEISGIRKWDDSLDDGKYSFTITAGAGTDETYLPEIKTVKNSGHEVKFDEITFDKPGTYTYTVSEDNASMPGGITRDESVWTVTVAVSIDSATHALKVDSVNYSKIGVAKADNFTFTNKYTATAAELTNDQKAQLKITKNLTGPISDVTNRDYEFTVTRTKAPEVPKNFTLPAYSGETVNITVDEKDGLYTGEGNINLEDEYTYPGEYVYEVSETDGAASGVTYDNTKYTVTVVVSDNKEGELSVASVEITKDEDSVDEIVFNNEYSVEPVTANDFNISKTLKLDATKFSGQSVNFPEDFKFNAVIKKDGAEVTDGTAGWEVGGALSSSRNLTISQTAGEVGRGTTTVPGPKFTATGTYVLEITENNPTDSHIAKDSLTLTVTYTVSDKGGKLVVEASMPDDLTFNNSYEPEKTGATVSVGKKLINTVTNVDLLDNSGDHGVAAYNGAFSFTLEDVSSGDGAEVKVGSTENNWGGVKFGDSVTSAITFDRAGTFKFKITEEDYTGVSGEGEPEITTSEEEIYVVYEVTVDSNGKLEVGAPKYSKKADSESAETSISADEAFFKNTYGPVPCVLTISKEITTEPDGIEIDKDQTFTFKITLEDGGEGGAVDGTIQKAIDEDKIFYVFQPAGGIMTTALEDSEGDGRIYVKTATFEIKLKAGQSVQIQGIPYLTKYAVSEINVPTGYTISEITHDKTTQKYPASGDSVTGDFTKEQDKTNVKFTNLYTLNAEPEALPELTKVLSGRALVDGEFSFTATITDEKGAATDGAAFVSGGSSTTAHNSADGKITLENINFTKPGTYKITVEENENTAIGDMDFDDKEIVITYTVTDNKNGALNVSAPTISDGENPGNDSTFENVFETGELSITNTTTDKSTGEYTYTITLTAPSGVTLAENYTYTVGGDERSLTVDSTGKAKLTLKGGETAVIKDLPAGTHFEITETPASGYVLTYVEVNNISASLEDVDGSIEYEKTTAAHFWNSKKVTAKISGTKQIEGIREWSSTLDDGKYSFTITAGDGTDETYLPEIKAIKNSGHEVKFDEITYDQAGTYTYTVAEDSTAMPGGITRDESVWTVTVDVSIDSTTHELTKSVNYSKTGVASASEFTFTNKYTVKPTTLTEPLKITKNLTGPISAATNLEYSFTVTRKSAPAGAPATTYSGETVNITVGEKDGLYTGEGTFNLEEYTYPGKYVYEVSENSGAASGITYDSTVYTVTVVVEDNKEGTLSVKSVTITGGKNDGNIVFNNTYSVEPVEAAGFDINKTLKLDATKFSGQSVNFPASGFAFKAVIKKDGAEVADGTAGWLVDGKLSSSTDLTISQTAGEVGRGTTTVPGPKFTATGTYVLEITEEKPSDPHITTAAPLTVTYTVTDKGGALEVTSTSTDDLTFNNIYEPEKTGVTVSVKKKLINTVTGVDLLDNTDGLGVEAYNGKFSFKLENVSSGDGATINVPTATNEWGDVKFGDSVTSAITFDRAGTFKFKITETSSGSVIEGEPEITTSTEEIYVQYDVTVNDDGKLEVGAPKYTKKADSESAETSITEAEAFFTNTYGPVPCVLTISKEIETEPDGIEIDKDQTFTFEITLEDGDAVDGTIQKAIAEGKIFYVFQPAGGIMTTALNDSGEGGRTYVEAATFEIKLKAGQSVQIQGIPYLTKYAVSEINVPTGYTISEITHDKTTESNPASDYSVTGKFTEEEDTTEVNFTNLYKVGAKTEELPELTKVLSGRALVDGEFSFTATITDEKGAATDGAAFVSGGSSTTARNSADGKITLGNINFTKPGTYKVTVKENVDMTIGDVVFDKKEIVITYKVTDNKDGTLNVSAPTISGNDTTFENVFETGDLSIENTTTDKSTDEYTFEITLTAPDGVTLAESYTYTIGETDYNLTVDSDGKAELKLKGGETAVIKGLPAGTHFEITETPASGYVLTYVTVGGTEDADKTANGTIPNGSVIAAHFWNSPVVKQIIRGTKQISGIREWSSTLDDGKYSFTITAGAGTDEAYLPENKTVKNSDHEVKFGEITYDKPGTYTYTVAEEDVPAAVGGVSKDESKWTVTVTVSIDSTTHELTKSVEYKCGEESNPSGFTFTNTYSAEATAEPQTLKITKKIATNEGINPAAEDYRFEAERVSPAGDEFSETYTISMAAGELEKSAEIELEIYTEPGEYVYEIAEIAGGTVGMTYDSGRFRVTVEVSDDSIGGLHSAIKSIEKIGEGEVAGVVFENKFATGTLEITKKTRGLGVDPLEEFKFTISLKDENGEPLSGEYGYTTEGSGFRPFGPAPFALANLNVVSDGSEISLKAGDTVKIVGLPVGAVYTVSEEDAGGYSVFVSTNSGAEVESASASGKIVDGTTSLVFVNEKQKQFEFKQFAFKNEIYPGDGESVEPGDEIIYELGWQNPTLKEATIVITDKLDNHVEYVDTGDERLSYDPGTHTVTATVEAGPLKSGTLELTVRVKPGAHGDIENKASATVDGTEYECETEEIKNPVAGITVEKAQTLSGGEKTESLVEARRGDVITYYLTVTANSEDPSAVEKNVTVKDMIPEGLSVVAGSISNGGEIDENGLMSWNLGELAAGESVTVSYSVEIPQVSKDSTWSGKGYVYAGEDPAENEPDDSKIGEEGYHWKASEELSAHAVGDLVLTKRVISSDGSSIPFGVEFDFTIELSLNGEPLAGGYVYETTSGASGAVFDGKLETELADGESVTIKSLPAGAEYRISESPVVNYQSDKTDNTDFGAVLNTANEVIFTNDYSFVAAEVGGLTVTNVVIGEPEDLEKTFTFTVTLLDGGINGTYGEMTFIDGVATFTLSNGMSIEARGLPSHIGYTVSEAEANADGFTTQSVNAEGAIPVGTSADAVFTNFKRASASGKLVIRSAVDGTIQDEAASYGFTVTLDDPGVNGLYGDLFFENGVARAAIVGSSSVSASGLPAGAGYSVVFDGAFGGGISVSAHNDVGVIPAGGTATADFVISRELGNLTVMKTVSGEAPLAPQEYGFTVTLDDFNINGTYGEMTFIGGTASFSLSGGQSATAYGLPAGVGYSVSEEPGAGYTVSASGNIGVIPQSATATASFINTYAAPLSLTITKATVGKPAELPFDFRVTLTPPAGEILDSVAGIMLDEFGAGVIQIYGGQSAIISGIPEGTQYTVEELYSGAEFNTEPAKSGIISAAGEAVTFVNTRKVGSLTVRNTIVGTAADLNRAFNFTVTLSDPSISGRFGDMTFVGGTASFALSGGQSLTASDLPAGTGFTVNETDAGADGYTATVFGLSAESGYSGFIAENTDSEVEFINEKNGAPALGGSLTVINNVIGTTTDELFTFTVKFTDLSGNVVFPNAPAAIGFAPFAATSGEPVYNPDGTVTVSLKHGESQTFTGLPAETLYEVVETGNLYYSVTSITPQGLIPDGSMAVAVFNNRWNAGGLDISVKVENDLGAILDYDESEYEFTVTLSDFGGSALSGFVYPSHIPASGWGETDADVLMSFDENGVATFTLKNGQSASAPDLPGGIGYTIEAVSKDGRYIGKISGTNTEIASGNTVAAENVAEDFTFIIRTGSIKITKTLLNYYGELLDSKRVGFEFEVKLVAPDGSVLKGAYVYSDGEHRGAIESGDIVTIYNEEPLTISGIPEGTSYEIVEESKQGYMITEKTGIEGIVSVGATAEVGYTNKIAGMIPPVPADQKDPDDDKPSGGGGGGGTEPDEPDEPDEPEDPDDGQTEVIPGDDIIIDRPTEGAFAAEDPASAVKRAAAKGAFPAALGLAALALSRRLRAK